MPWGWLVTTANDQVWCGKVYLRSVKSVSVVRGEGMALSDLLTW